MTTSARPSGSDVSAKHRPEFGDPFQSREEALDWAVIAGLTNQQIGRMTREELVRVIRATHLPYLSQELVEHVQFCDRPTLEKMVYLARRCCRNRGY
jgi:hypothetical protein